MQLNYPFTDEELTAIAALPVHVQALADKYPKAFENYAVDWQSPELPPGTLIDPLEVFYGAEGTDGPELCWMDGVLSGDAINPERSPAVVQCLGIAGWLFIAVEGHVLINRWLDAVLPNFSTLSIDAHLQALQLGQV